MARHEYIQIPQSEDVQDDEDDIGESPSAVHLRLPSASSSTSTAGGSSSASSRPTRPARGRPGKIDLRSLDNAFKRWTMEITQKVMRKKKKMESEAKKEIVFSVFQRVSPPSTPSELFVRTLDDGPPMTDRDFDAITNSVRVAILDGVHPKIIAKGSSGSYFARGKRDERVQVVGVFKPKDEEANVSTANYYNRGSPSRTAISTPKQPNGSTGISFAHLRNDPMDSYVSEAAASLLDDRLSLQIVPRTKLVSLSSPAFSYGWIDRANYKKGKPLPEKVGSLQTFLNGYQDATAFLREHPWPGRAISDTYDDTSHRSGSTFIKGCSAALGVMCGRIGEVDEEEDYDELYDRQQQQDPSGTFSWTPLMQQEFREELEKLIILDYLMRNTDRGLDNFMVKYCEGKRERTVVNRAPAASPLPQVPMMTQISTSSDPTSLTPPSLPNSQPNQPHSPTPPTAVECDSSYTDRPHIHIAAIDNSLSFPHQHPKGWRDFTYGWLFLPVSLIGRPFSKRTRDHFLPLLSDPVWWAETTYQLRQLHKVDDGYSERMFRRQLAVMKGQGWNIVQCLKHLDEGPLELTRRTKVMVWDDEIEVPVDATPEEIIAIVSTSQSKSGVGTSDVAAQPTVLSNTSNNSPGQASVPNSPPRNPRSPPSKLSLNRRARSYSIGSRLASLGRTPRSPEFPSFPFPGRAHGRRGSQADLTVRPVPLSSKKLGSGAIRGGATGVSVLEHLEKLDVVESGLNRVIGDGVNQEPGERSVLLEAEEDDVGESGSAAVAGPSGSRPESSPERVKDDVDPSTQEVADKRKPATTLDLGHPPRRSERPGSIKSAIEGNTTGERSLEQLLGSDDLESGLQNGHTRWATDERRPTLQSPTAQSFDFTPQSEPLRRTRIVIAERLETVDARPFFSSW
ncbi:phosphatidyl inositol kinase [Tulasnella sp. 403]|nr:phosphatidyl inositol kinase [Tulasnella sp. 403]